MALLWWPRSGHNLAVSQYFEIHPTHPQARLLRRAAEVVRDGAVIVYPTDTGYAFGCALSSKKGINALRKLKGIDEKHWKPLTMLVDGIPAFGRYGAMDNYWPNPPFKLWLMSWSFAADSKRPGFEPLQEVAADFQLEYHPPDEEIQFYIAYGSKAPD